MREKTTQEQAISLPEPLTKQLLGDIVRGASFLNTMPLCIPKAGVTFNGEILEVLEVLPLNARNRQGTRNGHIDHADRTSTQEVEGPKDSLSSGAE